MTALRRIPYHWVFWWILSNSVAVSQSPSLWFKRLSVQDGLPSTHVNCIFQDSKGFMWFGTWKGLCRYDGYNIKTYRHNPDDLESVSQDAVGIIIEDQEGMLWIATEGDLEKFDPVTETFRTYFPVFETLQHSKQKFIRSLCIDKTGTLWAAIYGKLYYYNKEEGAFALWDINAVIPYRPSNPWVLSLCPTKDSALWVNTPEGIFKIRLKTKNYLSLIKKEEELITDSTALIDGNIYMAEGQTAVVRDDIDGSWWISSNEGLKHCTRPDLQHWEMIRSDPNDPEGLNSNEITAIFQDKEGSIWIGTDNGINILTPEARNFRHYKSRSGDETSLNSNRITSVFGSKDGLVWLGTLGGGLNCLDPQTGLVRRYSLGNKNSLYADQGKDIFRVYEDREGDIWVGLYGNGLGKLNPKTNTFQHRKRNALDLVSCFYEDDKNTLWIGHAEGFTRYNKGTQKFEFMKLDPEWDWETGNALCTGILQDFTGAYWIGSNGYYLVRFDPVNMKYHRYLPFFGDPSSISTRDVQAVYEDKKRRLWIGSATGIDLYLRENDAFQHYGFKDGSTYDITSRLLEDGQGNLWTATTNGLLRFDPVTATFRTFNKVDGLCSDESWDLAKNPKNGALLLATSEGLTIFHPDSLQDNTLAPSVVFTKITRLDATVGKSIEEKGASSKNEWTFSYKDDVLMFEFSALSYRKTAKNQYAYKLEGLSSQWVSLGTKHDLTLTNLSPGSYVLRVKASNGDGLWNETGTAIKITILPPWWASWPALIFYAAAAIALLYFIYRFQLSRKLAAAENRRLKEMDLLKTRLYTNITHEFRTPLTVISGMAQQIKEAPERWIEEGPDIIQRNSDGLLRLVNQMLELNKLEAGMLPVHLEQWNVVAYLKYLLESFHSFADSKDITLSMESQWDGFVMDFDADKMLHIVSNLLSNAIKFTPNGGKVTLSCSARLPDSTHLDICIRDTGIGISPEDLPHIFERFHQVDGTTGGSGIGLTLARELVLLLGGSIGVESVHGQGSAFTVTLPVSRQAPFPTEREKSFRPYVAPLTTLTSAADQSETPLVHIVEDNADVVRYLRACLEPVYRVTTAPNGKSALE